MNINSLTNLISKTLIGIDRALDLVPVISTVTNLTALFQKYAVIPHLSEKTINRSRYFQYVRDKDTTRCLYLLVPMIGNIAVCFLKTKPATPIKTEINDDTDPSVSADTYNPDTPTSDAHKFFNLAEKYAEGKDVVPNPDEAFRLYKIAAEKGHHKAAYKLGLCYLNKFGLPQSEIEETHRRNKASENFRIAAKKSIIEATVELGKLALEDKDTDNAQKLFETAAEQHNAEALYELYKLKKNFNSQEAKRLIKLSADKNHIQANYQIGCDEEGNGNTDSALKHFQKAADSGHIEACFQTALLLLDCNNRDINKALHYLLIASNQDHILAKLKICDLCETHEIKGIREEEISKLYMEAAQAEDKLAIEKLAYRYEKGLGFSSADLHKAASMHRKLDDNENSIKWLYHYTKIQQRGSNLRNDFLEKAAALKDPEALFELYIQNGDQPYLDQAVKAGNQEATILKAKQLIETKEFNLALQILAKIDRNPEALYLQSTISKDLNERKRLLKLASDLDYEQAKYELALMTIVNPLSQEDEVVISEEILDKVGDQNKIIDDIIELGEYCKDSAVNELKNVTNWLYIEGGENPDNEKKCFEAAARLGHAEAALKLSEENGDYLNLAAEGGHRYAQRLLARQYLDNYEFTKGRELLVKANLQEPHIESIVSDLAVYVKACLSSYTKSVLNNGLMDLRKLSKTWFKHISAQSENGVQ